MANRRKSHGNHELAAHLREMTSANETAQRSLGTARKDWMNTAIPPRQHPHNQDSNNSRPQTSNSTTLTSGKGKENASITAITSRTDAKQALTSNQTPSMETKMAHNFGRSIPQTSTKDANEIIESIISSTKGSKVAERTITAGALNTSTTSLPSQMHRPQEATNSSPFSTVNLRTMVAAVSDVTMPSIPTLTGARVNARLPLSVSTDGPSRDGASNTRPNEPSPLLGSRRSETLDHIPQSAVHHGQDSRNHKSNSPTSSSTPTLSKDPVEARGLASRAGNTIDLTTSISRSPTISNQTQPFTPAGPWSNSPFWSEATGSASPSTPRQQAPTTTLPVQPQQAASVLSLGNSNNVLTLDSFSPLSNPTPNYVQNPPAQLPILPNQRNPLTTTTMGHDNTAMLQNRQRTASLSTSTYGLPIAARQDVLGQHTMTGAQPSRPVPNMTVPLLPAPSHQSSYPTLQGSQIERSIDHGIRVLPLDQFARLANQNIEQIWGDLQARLHHRVNDLNSMAGRVPFSEPLQRHFERLYAACEFKDTRYLLFSQTALILRMPLARNLVFEPTLAAANTLILGMFGDINEENKPWFLNFPCICPATQGALRQWFHTLSTDIIALCAFYDNLSRTCTARQRPPLMAELDTNLWFSDGLRVAAFASLVTRGWSHTKDQCYFKAIDFFARGLSTKRHVLAVFQPAQQIEEMNKVHRDVDTNVMMCFREHKAHTTPVTAIQPTEVVARRFSVDNLGMARLVATPQTQPSLVRMPMQASVSQSISPAQHAVSIQQFTPPPQINRVLNPLQPTPRAMSIPLQHIQNGHSDRQGPTTATPVIGSNIQTNQPALVFPVQNGPHPPQYGFPLHHRHLMDPFSVMVSPRDGTQPYRSFVADFFVGQPATFTAGVFFQRSEFILPEDTLLKFPREQLDPLVGRARREVQAGNEIVRLRGASIKQPQNFSEWYVAETHWPNSIAIILNDGVIEFRKKPQYAKDLPVDVTSRLKQGVNTIQIAFVWLEPPPTDFQYTVGLEKIVVADINTLAQEVRDNTRIDTEEQLRQYFVQPSDNEVEMMLDHLDISLRDPFSSSWPTIPTRTISCAHFQCFDLEPFLEGRTKDINKPEQFLCPLCGKDARPTNLRVDGWMAGVIQKLHSDNQMDARMIRVTPDLNWTVKAEAQASKTNDGDEVQAGPSRTTIGNVEIIELD